ncbi:MAG: DUF3987 domain-containing protein [Planctomycetota bacterium]
MIPHPRLNIRGHHMPPNLTKLRRWNAHGEGKVPIDWNGNRADHVKSRCSYDEAIAIAEKHGEGIGYSIDNKLDGTKIVFVDLDSALDDQGNLKPWAVPIVERFKGGTYTQHSKSGRGIHFICEGTWNSLTKKLKYGGNHEAIEIYDTKRFVVMTGHNDQPIPVQNVQDALDWLAQYMIDQKDSIQERLKPMSQRSQLVDGYGCRVSGDWPDIQSRAEKYLDTIPPAISGQGGHDLTFITALKVVRGFDLSDEEAYTVMTKWSQRCQPPWNDADLQRKISEVQKNPANRGNLLRSTRMDLAGNENWTCPVQKSVWSEGEPYPEIDLAHLGVQIVPEFPIEAFPEPLSQIVRNVAERMGVHRDFLSVSILAVMGAAVGRSVVLLLKSGFLVWPSAWYAIVGKVGSGKSPAIRFAEKPIVDHENVLYALNQNALADWEALNSGKAKVDSKSAKPISKRLRVREATFAALLDAHAGNPLGLLYSPDELTTWLRGMDLNNRGASVDRSNWLSARQGGDISQDRISCGTRLVEKSAITLLGSIPPKMVEEITKSDDDGFLERLLFGYPHFEIVPMPKLDENDDSDDTNGLEWAKLVRWLIQARYDESDQMRTEPYLVNLKADRQAFEAYYNFECRMAEAMNEDDGPLRGFYSKIKWDVGHWALTLALAELGSELPAALNQAVSNGSPIVRVKHIENAVSIADYFLACAGKIVAGGGGMQSSDRRIIRRIGKNRIQWADAAFFNSSFNSNYRPSPSDLEKSVKRLFKANVLLGAWSPKGPYKVNPKGWDLEI